MFLVIISLKSWETRHTITKSDYYSNTKTTLNCIQVDIELTIVQFQDEH